MCSRKKDEEQKRFFWFLSTLLLLIIKDFWVRGRLPILRGAGKIL